MDFKAGFRLSNLSPLTVDLLAYLYDEKYVS